MPGQRVAYRHLGRTSSHRRALLRNLVTSLIEHESIKTTYAKAKEAQRLAEKLITLGKKDTEASRRRALSIFFTPHDMLPKLFGPLAERYRDRPGGYTRVLRTEPPKEDQAESAILELVDGPKDMRFAMVAKTIAHERQLPEQELAERNVDLTWKNLQKVTRYRKDGEKQMEDLVKRFEKQALSDRNELPKKEVVYWHARLP